MEPNKRHLMLLAFASGCLAACSGGSLTGPRLDAGSDVEPVSGDDAGNCSGIPRSGTEVPTTHRPTAIACSPTTNGPPVPDGGTQECATNADCANDAGSLFTTCLRGRCAFDQCLSDADCGNGDVCGCASDYYGGLGEYNSNVCVTANCHVDADCGPGGYCSPSQGGHCESFTGFYCHTKADTCVDQANDCVCGDICVYSPTVGGFTCALEICGG
jgi:hypothetical protein